METILTARDLIGRRANPKKNRPAERGMLPVTKVTLWRWIRDGDFPKPIKLGANRVGWRESVVRRWLDERERASAP
jgi:predicted DNA-binding transcriptional regulator AlpA